MSPSRYRIISTVSTLPQMMVDVEELLNAAGQQPSPAKALPACAALMMASTLAQGIHYRLRHQAHEQAFEHSIELEDTVAWRLSRINVPFLKKMFELPHACSAGRFELTANTPEARALGDLIRLRNRLVHIEEELAERDFAAEEIQQLEDGSLTLGLPLRPPTHWWSSVTLQDAERFRSAVGQYFSDVIERHPSSYVEGPLLRRTR